VKEDWGGNCERSVKRSPRPSSQFKFTEISGSFYFASRD